MKISEFIIGGLLTGICLSTFAFSLYTISVCMNALQI